MPRLIIVLAACLTAAFSAADTRAFDHSQWPDTDFSRAIIDIAELASGGVPRDGIPAIDAPDFINAATETGLDKREPVLALVVEGAAARAYPLRYLMWHEIVNDTVAGLPVAVTFCPLCNTALVFERRVGDEVLTFGVSGLLRHSDMVMFDRETESLWQQATAQGIVGVHAGAALTALPAWVESWSSFLTARPQGLVMARPAAQRRYGANPYVGYDTAPRPFLYRGEPPPHGIHPLSRVVRVGNRAWPLERLRQAGETRQAGVVITWRAGMASALDTPDIAQGRDIGQIRVRDKDGKDITHDIMFAFAFHAFWPRGEWMLAEE